MKTASTGAKHAVGIFGGSFDPVHRGHLSLVQYLLAQGVVEEVWLMVSPLNPLKSSFHLSPDDVRLDGRGKCISKSETRSPGTSAAAVRAMSKRTSSGLRCRGFVFPISKCICRDRPTRGERCVP